MISVARFCRVAAGAAVLLVLVVLGVRLVPVYLRNLELQRFVEETVQETGSVQKPDELLRVAVVDKAARLGLPVKVSQVRVKRAEGKLRIEVLYIVPVDLPLYTVKLHFRPSAGGR